ncbi:RDD family protein [Fodinicola feengrottensis]|uniref:RDD family protein n=1 Tax=Fodinicola feengrottensis TaxID=435914 RepID=UPI0013D80971|nr:RDD family protein [Fodinicola feengrottensis]
MLTVVVGVAAYLVGGGHRIEGGVHVTWQVPVAVVGFSVFNRILVQWIFRASIGKLIVGLRVVTEYGERAGFWQLVRYWFRNSFLVAVFAAELGGGASSGLDPGKSRLIVAARHQPLDAPTRTRA